MADSRPGSGADSGPGEVSAGNSGPVTISIARKVVPGREADYETWVRGITADALTFPGHLGVNVITPRPPSREYVTIFRFDTYEHLAAWKNSPVRARWLEKLEGIVEGKDEERRGTGLEFWFSLPELPLAHPSPHKMALVLLVVVYLIVLLLHVLLAPLTEAWPYSARALLAVLLQVTLMTYVVMPRVTKMLKGWLYH
jgi:antibiotic biosynthesis monooxygenase (ABM) superfamily enzyme